MIYQKISNITYSNLAKNKNSLPSEKAGRHKSHSGLEKIIFEDIKKKLKFKKNDELLDIGCGCGPLADYIVRYCKEKKINLTLCDIPDVIKILKKKYSKSKNITFLKNEFQKEKINNKFNKILCYSVIQCVNQPTTFYKKIINTLSSDGKALIGDIPNINKKYRFIKSNFGRKFEEKRLKKKIIIKNFHDLLKTTKQNKLINDSFVKFILKHSKKQGRKSYLIKQPKRLPFSYTREDVLIEEI